MLSKQSKILTSNGIKKISELIGKQFEARVDGENYMSTKSGFFKSGRKMMYELSTSRGHKLKVTGDHKILTENRGWVIANELLKGDEIAVYNNDSAECCKGSTGKFRVLKELKKEDVYDCTIPIINAFYANDIYVHNCEIGMWPITKDGKSGISQCNLVEINGKYTSTRERFLETCRGFA